MALIYCAELLTELNNLRDVREDPDEDMPSEDYARLTALEELEDEVNLNDANALVPDADWVEFAKNLAEGIGSVDDAARWPATCIDWDQAAAELAQDYTMVDFDAESYYLDQ